MKNLENKLKNYKETIEEILDFRLDEMGVSLEYYKETDDEDEKDTIVDLCLEVLED